MMTINKYHLFSYQSYGKGIIVLINLDKSLYCFLAFSVLIEEEVLILFYFSLGKMNQELVEVTDSIDTFDAFYKVQHIRLLDIPIELNDNPA